MRSMRMIYNSERVTDGPVTDNTTVNGRIFAFAMEQRLQQLHEFPVLLEDKNEIVTLFLNDEDMAKASQDSTFLQNLIAKEQNKNSNNESEKVVHLTHDENVDQNNADQLTTFVWPDKAVLLLIELCREREEEFANGFKRSNKLWGEIAAQMKETNSAYNVTALQCSSKMSGLKRTYKNIIDLNKKSGNHRNTWAFFSVMDSLFGNKASIKPPAIATSEGPSDPNEEESLLSTVSSLESKEPPKKRRRIENVMEQFLANITAEKEERKEDIKRREANKEKRREENKEERNRKHKEQMEVQKSLISTLQQFLNKI